MRADPSIQVVAGVNAVRTRKARTGAAFVRAHGGDPTLLGFDATAARRAESRYVKLHSAATKKRLQHELRLNVFSDDSKYTGDLTMVSIAWTKQIRLGKTIQTGPGQHFRTPCHRRDS